MEEADAHCYLLLKLFLTCHPAVVECRLTHLQFATLWNALRVVVGTTSRQENVPFLIRFNVGRRSFSWSVPAQYYFSALLRSLDFLSRADVVANTLALEEFRRQSALAQQLSPLTLFYASERFQLPVEMFRGLAQHWPLLSEALSLELPPADFQFVWEAFLRLAVAHADESTLPLPLEYLQRSLGALSVPRRLFVHAVLLRGFLLREALERQAVPGVFRHVIDAGVARLESREATSLASIARAYSRNAGVQGRSMLSILHENCPAARALRPYTSEILFPLAPSDFTSRTGLHVCQWCFESYSSAADLEVHVQSHLGALTSNSVSYRLSVLAAHALTWPKAIPTALQAWCLRWCQETDAGIICATERICPVCALRGPPNEFGTASIGFDSSDFVAFHALFSARRYFAFITQQYQSMNLPDGFIGLLWQMLYQDCVPVPLLCMEYLSDLVLPDAWVLFHSLCQLDAVTVGDTGISLHCCTTCFQCLSRSPPDLPPEALANGQWSGRVPAELLDLTEAEVMFVSRGFTLRKLKHLQHHGDPLSRQSGVKDGSIAFPQDGAQLLHVLPPNVSVVAEYLLCLKTALRYTVSKICGCDGIACVKPCFG